MSHEQGQKIVIYWSTKKTISVICALLLIPTVMMFLFSLTLKKTIINPNYYKKVLVRADTYNRLINDGIPSLILEKQVSDNTLTDSFAKNISVILIQKFIDPDWVKSQTENLIETVAGYFSRSSGTINFDLSGAKGFLSNVDEGLAIAEQVIPSCAQAQSNPTQVGKLLNTQLDCDKMSVSLDEIKDDLGGIRTKISQTNLGVVNLNNYFTDANSLIESVKSFAGRVNTYLWISLAILVALTLAIVLLEINDIPFAVKAFVSSVGIGSVITLGISLILRAFVSENYISASGIQLPEAIRQIANDITRYFVVGIFRYLIVASLISIAVVLAIYIMTVILEKKGFKFWSKAG